MTTRRRHNALGTCRFNAMSMAIIAVAALHIHTASAQMTAPSSPAPTSSSATSADNARYSEAFARADKNNDGKLSKEEAENLPALAQRFEQIDTDKDGFISKAEYMDALKP
jgi:Ca2+-binding EF-hand superfamily protein